MKRIEGEWRYFDEDLNIPYPWYTKPCLEWLKGIDISEASLFEYGVGDSTAWYRNKAKYVHGIDSDSDWVLKTRGVFTNDPQLYIEAPLHCGRFWDIIIIDGDYRDRCTEFALRALKPGGYLIIDNYKQPSADLEHWPLTEKLIEGMPITIYKEPGHPDWQTAVITKP